MRSRLGSIIGLAALGLVPMAAHAANDGKADPALLLDSVKTFPSLELAKRACAGDAVVWADRYAGFYYDSRDTHYGTTPQGSFACRADARKARYWSTDPRDGMDGHPGRTFPFEPLFVGS